LTSDKITANDALISTDVDMLIRTISERKKVSIKELELYCNMDRRVLEKWINVLEDEGYISLSYSIRGTNVVWLGDTPAQDVPVDTQEIDEVLSAMPAKENKDPEKRLEDYMRRRQDDEEVDLKSNILGSLDENPSSDEQEPKQVVEDASEDIVHQEESTPSDDEPEDVPEARNDFVKAADLANAIMDESDEGSREPEYPDEPMPPRRVESERNKQVKDLVNAYMNQINSEKAELERLKAEKERLYRENYLALESKVEADITKVTESILEKEGRILEAKERVLDLPSKVEEVEAVHESVKKLETDGKEILAKTREEVEQFIAELDRSKEEITNQITRGKDVLEKEKEKMGELDSLSDSVESTVSSISTQVDSSKAQIDELNHKMSELLNELEEATEMKVELTDMVEQVRASIGEKEAQLDDLETQMEKIDNVEKWAREYVVDYEQKVDAITRFVEEGEEDLLTLKKGAQSAYMKKYLRELDGITQEYESMMEETSSQENEIDQRIADSKQRLSGLVKESKEMMRKLRSGSAPDYEAARVALTQKTGRVLAMIDEKEAERGRLSEDMDEARSGRPRDSTPRASRKKSNVKKKKSSKKKGRKKK
jgi:chromosome segregation ATPase